jgi:hypothetical protein
MRSSTPKNFLFAALLGAVALLAGCPPADSGVDEDDTLPPLGADAQCLRWETQCGSECVDRQTDTQNCGQCGRACDAGQLCSEGACVDECPDGYERCGDGCVDLDNSEEHCGSCDNRCLNAGAEGYCGMGECTSWVCRPDRLDEDGDRSNGCERTCEGRRFDGSQTWDVDLDVYDVRGTLTVDGDAPEGREVGALVFDSLDTNQHVFTGVFPRENYNYRLNMYPGLYTVRLVDDDTCNPRYQSCPGPVVEDVIEITGDETIDLNLGDAQPFPGQQVSVTGEIKVDGQTLADQPQGSYRARVTFAGTFRHHRFFVAPEGPSTFQGQLPAGTYRVSVQAFNCTAQQLPCQEKVIDPELTITSDVDFDWNLETALLTGEVTANGAHLPDSVSGAARGTVELRPTGDTAASALGAALSATGPGEFSLRVYPGTYDLWLRNQTDCPGDGTAILPCKDRLIERDIDLTSSDRERVFDVPVVTLDGAVTLNGGDMIDSPANRNRGRLEFTDDQGTQRVMFGPAGPVDFGIKMYPGSYDVTARNASGCDLSRPVIPCQQSQLGRLEVEDDQTYDVDLRVVSLTGELTVDGEPFPDVERRSRGTVMVLSGADEEGPSADLGSRGAAEFSIRMFGGEEHRVVFNYPCGGEDDFLPCGSTTLVDGLDLEDDRRITRDLRPIDLSGTISINGTAVTRSDGDAQLILRNTKTTTIVPLGGLDRGSFDALAYSGTYRVEYDSRAHVCQGGLPCGHDVVRETFSTSSRTLLDVNLDVIELDGAVDFGGINETPNGYLTFLASGQEIRVNTLGGSYGPVQLFDRPYRIRFQQDRCRQQDDVPCMPYLVAGCE